MYLRPTSLEQSAEVYSNILGLYDPRDLSPRHRTGEHWTDDLFVRHPELFLPWMESMKERAPAEVQSLQKIFRNHRLGRGSRVLDLACGIGRNSINLAKAGYEVVGVDISPLYLQNAKKWADTEGLADNVRFYRMDLRNAAQQLRRKKEEKFDAVINMGTSMGYYGREEDVRTFKNLREIAGPRALLVIETVNRDYLVKNFEPHSISKLEGLEWEDSRRLDLETSFMHNIWRFYRKTVNSRRLMLEVPVSHRVYSLHELKELVDRAGWNYHNSYGSLRKLTPVTTDSFHMTVVSRKNAY